MTLRELFWHVTKPRRLALTLIASALAVGTLATPAHADADAGRNVGPMSVPMTSWAQDTVYVVDHTAGATWPVNAAAEKLDNRSPLNLVRVLTCPTGAQCIDVYTRDAGGPGVMGLTVTASVGSEIRKADVSLDPSYAGRDYRTRLTMTCHELGHAVGLTHSTSLKSCMFSGLSAQVNAGPSKSDYRLLREMY